MKRAGVLISACLLLGCSPAATASPVIGDGDRHFALGREVVVSVVDPVHAIAGLQTIDIPLAELITLIPDPPHAYVKLRSNAVDLGWLLGDCNKRPVITVDVVDRAATIVVYKGDRASSSYCPDVANANGLTITFLVALESVKAEVHEGIPGSE